MERSHPRSSDSDVKELRHPKKMRRRDSSSGGEVRIKKKHSKRPRLSSHSHKKRKCRHSDSDSSLDSELSSTSTECKRKHKIHQKDTSSKKSSKKKHKYGHETVKRKKKKKRSKKKLHEEVESLEVAVLPPPTAERKPATRNVADIKAMLTAQTKVKGPMTKEEYERQQSIVRRVYDPDTGRHRLVKGDGEIIEEIVSRERHRAINKQATLGDGSSFQASTRRLL